jgi:hypothetical protein
MSDSTGTIEPPRRKWTQVSWKRVLIALAILFALGACFEVAESFFLPLYYMRNLSRSIPELSLMPTALQFTKRSPLAPMRIECFEYSFQTPWQQKTRRDFHTATFITFQNGISLLAAEPGSNPNFAADLRKRGPEIQKAFGSAALSSQYDWMTAELSATPAQMHWWTFRERPRLAILLGSKAADASEATAIFKIGNEELRGYQFNDSVAGTREVKLELFDVNDRRYQLRIFTGGSEVTQADINAIVASMRPIPHS